MMIGMFKRIVRIWAQHRYDICDFIDGRTSQPCYNYIIHMLFLTISLEAYVLYAQWFPLVSEEKRPQMAQMWAAICHYAEWPVYVPVHHPDGTVERFEVPQLPEVLVKSQTVKSRPRQVQKRYADKHVEQTSKITKCRGSDVVGACPYCHEVDVLFGGIDPYCHCRFCRDMNDAERRAEMERMEFHVGDKVRLHGDGGEAKETITCLCKDPNFVCIGKSRKIVHRDQFDLV